MDGLINNVQFAAWPDATFHSGADGVMTAEGFTLVAFRGGTVTFDDRRRVKVNRTELPAELIAEATERLASPHAAGPSQTEGWEPERAVEVGHWSTTRQQWDRWHFTAAQLDSPIWLEH